jgi:excisionase family DNA binding protein
LKSTRNPYDLGMADDVYFSTGQAARELRITQAKVRALCESEAIDSICTNGGQYRISKDEIERLKHEGLPAIPRPLPEAVHTRVASPARSNRGEGALLAEPSKVVIDSAEEVVRLENEVKAIGLRREKEEGLDWFRDREARQEAQEAESEEAERLWQNQAAVKRQRTQWEAAWVEYALQSVPWGVPQPYQLDVHQAVKETLAHLEPMNPATITRPVIDAAVARALAPLCKQKRIAETIEEVCRGLFDSGCKTRMRAAAASAIAQLRDAASADEMLMAAQNAVAPLVRQYEHARVCEEVVQKVWMELPGGVTGEWEEGKDAVREALADLPLSASRRELEKARTTALAPIRAAIAARQEKVTRTELLRKVDFRFYSWPDKLRKRAEADISEAINKLPATSSHSELERTREQVIVKFQAIHERRERKSRLIDSGVRQIRPYVDKLAVDYEFDADAYTIARDLEEPIRETLAEELRGDETDEQVATLVRRSVREELDIP